MFISHHIRARKKIRLSFLACAELTEFATLKDSVKKLERASREQAR